MTRTHTLHYIRLQLWIENTIGLTIWLTMQKNVHFDICLTTAGWRTSVNTWVGNIRISYKQIRCRPFTIYALDIDTTSRWLCSYFLQFRWKKNQRQNVITYSCTSIRSFDDNVDKFNKVNNVSHGKPQILSNIIFNRYWAIANESTTIASTIDVFSKLLINILRILDGFREFNVNISALLCFSAINLNVIVSSITKSYGFIQFKSTS